MFFGIFSLKGGIQPFNMQLRRWQVSHALRATRSKGMSFQPYAPMHALQPSLKRSHFYMNQYHRAFGFSKSLIWKTSTQFEVEMLTPNHEQDLAELQHVL